MLAYVAARIGQALLTLLASSVIVFALVRTSGSPVDLILPPDSTPAERDAMIRRLGLDRPLVYQYGAFLWSALHGDWGKSLRTGRPATERVRGSALDRLREVPGMRAVHPHVHLSEGEGIAPVAGRTPSYDWKDLTTRRG